MPRISDTFSGYMDIDNDTFVYNVTDGIVTLLPAQSEQIKQIEVFDKVHSRDANQPEYLFGTEGITKMAFLRNRPFSLGQIEINPIIRFATPIIIKASGNASGFLTILQMNGQNSMPLHLTVEILILY